MDQERQLDDLVASYHRCRCNDAFIDTFYDIFMAKSPEIAARFGNTDFTVQKLMLRQSLLEVLLLDQGLAAAREAVVKLARTHAKREITGEMYVMWLDSLCEAVRKHDPLITPELEIRWRLAMQKGIELMLSPEIE